MYVSKSETGHSSGIGGPWFDRTTPLLTARVRRRRPSLPRRFRQLPRKRCRMPSDDQRPIPSLPLASVPTLIKLARLRIPP